jgi:hypothetical protein
MVSHAGASRFRREGIDAVAVQSEFQQRHDTDDFCIDEDAGVAYVTTHRENIIDRVPLEPNSGVAGQPFTELLLLPSSAAWSRVPGEFGRDAYFTTDGAASAAYRAPGKRSRGATNRPPTARMRSPSLQGFWIKRAP